jgi:hypothetical protein
VTFARCCLRKQAAAYLSGSWVFDLVQEERQRSRGLYVFKGSGDSHVCKTC